MEDAPIKVEEGKDGESEQVRPIYQATEQFNATKSRTSLRSFTLSLSYFPIYSFPTPHNRIRNCRAFGHTGLALSRVADHFGAFSLSCLAPPEILLS